ncbi:AI-2E family transporter [Luteolibacter flavescens]|uniref:AI-2E family transporter n=1 Tax=Luteolibacter flavescens TaxID=1859460 RepID=A0ABT3FS06_9BACT|nr:AI-2E family transporter [Luteolibacter flavescens]MCW1885979.1 AI-2E family transporter [Luteolibacter flavescens]
MSEHGITPRKPRASQMVLLFAALVIGVAGLKAAQAFFVPVFLAFFIATISYPITGWLQRHKVPPAVSVVFTVLVDFAFLAAVVVLGVTIVGDLQEKWDAEYYELAKAKILEANGAIASKLDEWGVEDAVEKLNTFTNENLAELKNVKFAQIWTVSTGVVGRVLTFFATFGVVIVLTIFMLSEAQGFSRRFGAIRAARGPNFERLSGAMLDTQRYLGIKTVISLATGVLAGILCWVAGIDFFLLWGILAFVMNFIPAVGSLIASVPPILLALIAKDGGTTNAIVVAGGYGLINMFLDNFVQPTLLGKRFGLSILVVVLCVLFWGWLWGLIGIVLAVPLTMILKVILDNSDEFRWVAVAIGQEPRKTEGAPPDVANDSVAATSDTAKLPGGN